MWRLYQTVKLTHSRPSERVGIADRWAAYQFDQAVIYFGQSIDAALGEIVNLGTEKEPRYRPKYTLQWLLTDGNRIETEEPFDVDQFAGMDGAIVDEVT